MRDQAILDRQNVAEHEVKNVQIGSAMTFVSRLSKWASSGGLQRQSTVSALLMWGAWRRSNEENIRAWLMVEAEQIAVGDKLQDIVRGAGQGRVSVSAITVASLSPIRILNKGRDEDGGDCGQCCERSRGQSGREVAAALFRDLATGVQPEPHLLLAPALNFHHFRAMKL
ncbi:hypothetical protein BC567DRAFT_245759 [Phyllosticta citribraziliensis]